MILTIALGDFKYCCCKERVEAKLKQLESNIKELTKEEEWPEVFRKLNKKTWPRFYVDKYGINMYWCNLCNEHRKQIARLKRNNRCLTPWESLEAIKNNRYWYTSKKRLNNITINDPTTF
jgi:hypothetical protein